MNYGDKVKESSRTFKCLHWKVSYLCLCCAGHQQLSQAHSIESLHLGELNKSGHPSDWFRFKHLLFMKKVRQSKADMMRSWWNAFDAHEDTHIALALIQQTDVGKCISAAKVHVHALSSSPHSFAHWQDMLLREGYVETQWCYMDINSAWPGTRLKARVNSQANLSPQVSGFQTFPE